MEAEDRDPDYDGRYVFLPDVSQLRAGDIVLTSSVESRDAHTRALSKRICDATGSRYSHVLICTSPPTLAEANSSGVSSLTLGNCFVHALENIRVLRHADDAIARNAAAVAQQRIGQEYSIRQALQSLSSDGVIRKNADDGTFCSALVAQAFRKAGAIEFQAVPVERTTPRTFEGIGGLADVTKQIFHPALAPQNVERMSALDGDYAPTPSSPQTEVFQRYSKAARPQADRIVSEFPEAGLDRQTTYFGMLTLILDADRKVASIPEVRRVEFLSAIAELDTALAAQQADGAVETLLDDILASDSLRLQRDLEETFSANPDIDVAAMQSLYETGKDSLSARQTALDSMRAGRARASVERYCALQERTIRFGRQRQTVVEEILRRLGRPVI